VEAPRPAPPSRIPWPVPPLSGPSAPLCRPALSPVTSPQLAVTGQARSRSARPHLTAWAWWAAAPRAAGARFRGRLAPAWRPGSRLGRPALGRTAGPLAFGVGFSAHRAENRPDSRSEPPARITGTRLPPLAALITPTPPPPPPTITAVHPTPGRPHVVTTAEHPARPPPPPSHTPTPFHPSPATSVTTAPDSGGPAHDRCARLAFRANIAYHGRRGAVLAETAQVMVALAASAQK